MAKRAGVWAVLAIAIGTATPGYAADPERGRLLADVCLQCHSEQAFTRKDSTIDSLKRLRAEVRRWGQHSKPAMTRDDVSDLVAYLNERYYHFSR